MRKYISFPENEYASYLNRLNANKVIYTTGVSNEINNKFIYSSLSSSLTIWLLLFKHIF